MSVVELQSVAKRFGAVDVIPSINLTIPSGSFTVLVGPSGCGKSTLLRMIAGLEDSTSGSIRIDDVDVTGLEPVERGIAMVFQSYALYPHMNVAKNIGFALKLAGLPKPEIERRIRETAIMLQLDHLLTRKPRELSGGQRQRVAIGRAIVRNPKVFLFDEPLSNLDAALRGQMRVELADLHRRLGATMIYVTHDQVEAMTMADQIVVLNNGHIEQIGAPVELYARPATEFVAQFMGSPRMNFLKGEMAAKFGAETIGIRPEHLKIVDGRSDWEGTIRHSEHLGADIMAYVDIGNAQGLTVRLPGEAIVSSGRPVYIEMDRKHLHRFANGKRIAVREHFE